MKKNTYKIGLDCRMFSDSFTGIGRYNYELTKRLFKKQKYKGKDLEWVIFMNDPEFGKYDFPSHVKKVQVNAKHYSLSEQWHFLKLLWKEKCDLVHFTHFNIPFLYRSPFVVTIHDATISFFPGKKMNVWWKKLAYNLVFRNAIKSSKSIVTVSQNTKNDVVKLFPKAENKTKVIWNGLGNEFRESTERVKSEVRVTYNISSDFLLYTGVWREHKNLVGLIEAFNEVSKNHPKLELVITGKDDPYYPEVRGVTKLLGLQDKVKFVGLVPFEDLVALYSAAKVFVFPTFYEGFGFPPLEAMLTKTPVCASNTSSVPEVCGEAALYFDPYNKKEIVKSIENILTNEALRTDLIEKGILRTKLFSWDDCSHDVFEVYLKNLKKD